MIHHVSISARDPKHVAEVLAELMQGQCHPFPGPIANSFMAVSGDEHGSMIEVYPATVTLHPGSGDDEQAHPVNDAAGGYGPFHMLLSVPVDRATVERIGAREGWRTRYFGRAAPGQKPFFHVIEFWIENQLMVEVATPDMLEEYTRMFRPAALDQALRARSAA